MKKSEIAQYAKRALSCYEKAAIILTQEEKERIEVADFGLGRAEQVGLQILTYINTERVCAKEMVLFPWQTCPEHWHVATEGQPGKEETFRCRFGEVFLYVEGERNPMDDRMPATRVTVFHQVHLLPGSQYTIYPGTKHWFQAGPEGAVISEFSTHSTDETDQFTDADVVRIPIIQND